MSFLIMVVLGLGNIVFFFPQDIVICKYCYFSFFLFFAKSFCLSMLDVDELASKNSV